jgi:hypothetical protein
MVPGEQQASSVVAVFPLDSNKLFHLRPEEASLLEAVSTKLVERKRDRFAEIVWKFAEAGSAEVESKLIEVISGG